MMIPSLHSSSAVRGFTVLDRDGEAGTIEDVYFDQVRWVIRYLLLRHRTIGRDIPISPLIIDEVRWPQRIIRLRLFDEEIDAAPAIDTNKPITREQEKSYNEYFFIPDYWEGEDLWGEETTPGQLRSWLRSEQHKARGGAGAESCLLSASALARFTLHSPQGTSGKVSDFLWSPENYAVRFLVIDIGGLLSAKKTLLSPLWITALDRRAETLRVELPKEAIEEAPPYQVGEPITPAYEKNIMSHYNSLEYKTGASGRRKGL